MKNMNKYARIKEIEEEFARKASELKDLLYAINIQGIFENMSIECLVSQRDNLAKDFLKTNDLGAKYLELTNRVKPSFDYDSCVACSNTISRLLKTKIKKKLIFNYILLIENYKNNKNMINMFRRSCFDGIRRLEAFLKGGSDLRSEEDDSLENSDAKLFKDGILYTIIANPNTLEVTYEFP